MAKTDMRNLGGGGPAALTRRATIALFAIGGVARAQTPLTLRFSTAAPPGDFIARAMTAFKEAVERALPGEVAVNTYPASTLFRQGTEFSAIERGNLEMSTGTTFEVAAEIPELGVLHKGYLIRDYAHLRRVFDGPIGANYRATVAARIGVEILGVGYLGTRQVNLRTMRPVRTPQDLAGVKMRMTPDPAWQLLGRAIGVSPVPMGMAEVYLALKTGTVDGQDNPLTIMSAAKFYEVTQQVVLTSHLVQPTFFNIAAPIWKKLTDAQKAVVQDAARTALRGNDDARLANENSVAADLRAKGLTVTEVDLPAFRAFAEDVYASSSLAASWDKALMKQVADLA